MFILCHHNDRKYVEKCIANRHTDLTKYVKGCNHILYGQFKKVNYGSYYNNLNRFCITI